jgi:hypothetical protein
VVDRGLDDVVQWVVLPMKDRACDARAAWNSRQPLGGNGHPNRNVCWQSWLIVAVLSLEAGHGALQISFEAVDSQEWTPGRNIDHVDGRDGES